MNFTGGKVLDDEIVVSCDYTELESIKGCVTVTGIRSMFHLVTAVLLTLYSPA